jgi:hypothetical protein
MTVAVGAGPAMQGVAPWAYTFPTTVQSYGSFRFDGPGSLANWPDCGRQALKLQPPTTLITSVLSFTTALLSSATDPTVAPLPAELALQATSPAQVQISLVQVAVAFVDWPPVWDLSAPFQVEVVDCASNT